MMKKFKNLLILTIAILGFSFVNANAQTVSNDGSISQKEIERKVYKEILKMPYYGLFDSIGFEVDGSTVTLSGKVYNATNRKSAERIVKKIKGVDTVVNNIETLPPSGFDNSIRRQIVNEFANGGSLYRYIIGVNPSIRIIVDGGHVTLEGYVSNKSDSNLANILAGGVSGVFSITNNLIVTKDEPYR